MKKKYEIKNKILNNLCEFLTLKFIFFKNEKKQVLADSYNFNKELKEHSFRVAEYSQILAELMCLDTKKCKEVRRGAYLHDLGKVLISKKLLEKRENLSEKDSQILKHHSKLGLKILEESDRNTIIENIIAYHHERWDGKGYPFKLKEREIPIEARIVSVADSYDILRNKRSNKKPLSHQEVVDTLKKFSGVYYDPDIIIMLEIFGEHFN
ncbi:HD-GYP domain-containing protein [Cetobacterium sp.]|uniref:HD-GYP domain-containing protein n=1 Tax=Cetobacterium sp. TaxID=2071632 RepID=UPI003F3F0370